MKLFFKKLFSTLMTCAIICAIGYFFKDWFIDRYHQAKGAYYIYKGDVAYSQDNLEKTLEFYKRGLSLYPKHYEAWFNLGNLYAVHEDYFSAVEAYRNAIEHHPKFVMARMNLGIVYSEDLGFFDEAIEQFDIITDIRLLKLWIPYVYSNVKSIKGNRGIAYFNMGVAYKQKAMYLPIEKKHMAYQYLGDAIEAYTSSLKFLKNNYDVYYNRAVAHHLRGERNLAGLDYCKAINISPTKFEAHYNLAVLLKSMRRYRDSRDELQKAAMLITESASDSELQTAYIFNLLNEVTRTFISSDEYGTARLTDEPSGSYKYTYVNGKMIPDEDFDKAIAKNLKTCAGFEAFNTDDEDEIL